MAKLLSLGWHVEQRLLVHLDGEDLHNHDLLHLLHRRVLSTVQGMVTLRPATQPQPSHQSYDDHGRCLPALLCLLLVGRLRQHLQNNVDNYLYSIPRVGIFIHDQQYKEQEKDQRPHVDAGPQP